MTATIDDYDDALRSACKAHLEAMAERDTALREIDELRDEIARLNGDRCTVCDEDGLIYVTAWDHANGCESEEAAMCPACGGTRSGYASEVTKERDTARRSLAEALARVGALEGVARAADQYQLYVEETGDRSRCDRGRHPPGHCADCALVAALDAYRAGTPAAPRTEAAPPALTPPLTASEREALVEIRAKLEPGRCLCMCHVDKSRAIATIDRLLSGAGAATADSSVRGGEAAPLQESAVSLPSPSTSGPFRCVQCEQLHWRPSTDYCDACRATEPGGPPVPAPLSDTIKRPAGCTCHQEIGDSHCDVHPSCDGCGELIDPDSEPRKPRNWCGSVVCEPGGGPPVKEG